MTPEHAEAIRQRFAGPHPCAWVIGDIQVERDRAVLDARQVDSSNAEGDKTLQVVLWLREVPGKDDTPGTQNFRWQFRKSDGAIAPLDPALECLTRSLEARDAPLPAELIPRAPPLEPRTAAATAPLEASARHRDLAALWQPRVQPGPVRLILLGLSVLVLLVFRMGFHRTSPILRDTPRLALLLVALLGFAMRLLLLERLGDVRPIFLSSVGPDDGYFHRSSAIASLHWLFWAAMADLLHQPRWEWLVHGNRLLGIWGAWNLGMLAFGLTGRRRVAVITSMVATFFPPFVWASVTSSDVPLVFLLLSYGLQDLVLGIGRGHRLSRILGFFTLAMATEIRPETISFVVAAVLVGFSLCSSCLRDRVVRRDLLVGGLFALILMVPAFQKTWYVLHQTDLLSSERMLRIQDYLIGWWNLAFRTPMVCPSWVLLFAWGLWRLREVSRWLPAALLLAPAISTVALITGFMPQESMITDHRYFVPLLIFAALPVALALEDLALRLLPRSVNPVTRLLLVGFSITLIHLGAFPRLIRLSLETREFRFLRQHLVQVPDGAVVLIPRPKPVADALEPGNWISWLERRDIEWVPVTAEEMDRLETETRPLFFYRGGQCHAFSVDLQGIPENCQAIESRLTLETVAMSVLKGPSLAGARYPYENVPVGLYRVLRGPTTSPSGSRRVPTLDGGLPADQAHRAVLEHPDPFDTEVPLDHHVQ